MTEDGKFWRLEMDQWTVLQKDKDKDYSEAGTLHLILNWIFGGRSVLTPRMDHLGP